MHDGMQIQLATWGLHPAAQLLSPGSIKWWPLTQLTRRLLMHCLASQALLAPMP